MSTAQIVFSIALGVVAAVIVAFSVYVISTTVWGNRWVKVRPSASAPSQTDANTGEGV